MKWNKITLKLGGAIMILFLVVLLPLGFIINQIFSNFYYSKVQEEIGELSSKYAGTITTLDDQKILDMFKTLAVLTNKEIYIINEKGETVTYSTVQDIHLSEDEMDRLSIGKPVTKKLQGTANEIEFLVSGHPIFIEGSFTGAFFVLASVEGISNSIGKVQDLLILSGLGAFFLALGFTFVISRKMSDPLLEMEGATRQIAKGDLDVRLAVASGDEIGSLAQAINDLAYELDRYRSNRREFFANISHELRTPISYLQGYADVLKRGLYHTEAEKDQYLTIIKEESDSLTWLINDLFDLAKMEEGKIDLHTEAIDLGLIMKSTLSKIKLNLESKGLTLIQELEQPVPLIEGDGDRMEQIFMNLLSNAIRYTEKGGISVRLWVENRNVNIEIKDSGVGIPQTEIPFIFERFYRVEKSRSRQHGGTGLGLAIVKNLVELQNGIISVSSKEGEGTMFLLSFPIPEKEET
jgi:signal transduction histidine kinase